MAIHLPCQCRPGTPAVDTSGTMAPRAPSRNAVARADAQKGKAPARRPVLPGMRTAELLERQGRTMMPAPADIQPDVPAVAVPQASPQTDLGAVLERITDGVGDLPDNLAALIALHGVQPLPATFRAAFSTGAQTGTAEVQVRGTARKSFIAYRYKATLVADDASSTIEALELFSGVRDVTQGAMAPEAIQCDVAARRFLERPVFALSEGILRSALTAPSGRTVASGSFFVVQGFLVPDEVAERIRRLVGQLRVYSVTSTDVAPLGNTSIVTGQFSVARVFRQSTAPTGTIARVYLGANVGQVNPVGDMPPTEWPTYDEGGLRAPRVIIPVGDRITLELVGLGASEEVTFFATGGER